MMYVICVNFPILKVYCFKWNGVARSNKRRRKKNVRPKWNRTFSTCIFELSLWDLISHIRACTMHMHTQQHRLSFNWFLHTRTNRNLFVRKWHKASTLASTFFYSFSFSLRSVLSLIILRYVEFTICHCRCRSSIQFESNWFRYCSISHCMRTRIHVRMCLYLSLGN